MMKSKNSISASLILIFIVVTSALVELPRVVEDNNILTTETAIRNTINTLFTSLQLRDAKKNPKLKEYSIVHNHLISFTLQDYYNLREIAKLTRVDKKTTNNQSLDFMTALNDLLNENIEKENKRIGEGFNDNDVKNYVEQLLATIESLKQEYGLNNGNLRIKNAVYEVLQENEISMYNDTESEEKFDKTDEEDPVLGRNYFWKPEEPARRVYQGKRVKIKHFPFMASIHIFNQFYCSGSIIKSDLIISASSCLQLAYNNRFFRENPAFLSVRVGSTFYNGGENIAVMEVYFHPQYNPQTLQNNLCILRLVRKINLKRKRVKKIDFDRNESPLPSTTEGITLIGWGAKRSNNLLLDPWHQQLAYAVLDFYPLRECQEVYSRNYVTKKNFCAGFFSIGGGACNRDVGGPGIVEGTLVGVASFGSPLCGTPDAPTVFTKLGYYTSWIEDIMEQDVPSGLQRTTLKREREHVTIPDYSVKTTFKISPLRASEEPLPIQEVDALRMLQDSKVFQEFLETMFNNKEQKLEESSKPLDKIDYQGMLLDKSAGHGSIRITAPVESVAHPTTATFFEPLTSSDDLEDVDTTNFDTVEIPHLATAMNSAEPEVTKKHTTKNKKVTEPVKEVKPMKENKDAELEQELVDLIDNLDLKDIIENISSLEDDQIVDTKLFDMIGNGNEDGKAGNINDTVLTLLYLSDSEKVSKIEEGKKDSDGNVNIAREKGLSIDAAPFRDMTFRAKNTSMLDSSIRKDLYDIFSDNTDTSETEK